MIAQMTELRPTATATLEMDLRERAPEGSLTFADGRCLIFAGWTELASAIEEWRAQARAIGSSATETRSKAS